MYYRVTNLKTNRSVKVEASDCETAYRKATHRPFIRLDLFASFAEVYTIKPQMLCRWSPDYEVRKI